MALLALEASSDACSVALEHEGRIHQIHRVEARAHTRLLLPMIDELLGVSGIDTTGLAAIAFGHGPGSFTGLRLAVAVTQGIAWARCLPVVGVSSLAALAETLRGHRPGSTPVGVATLVDARMDEVYVNAFRCDERGVQALGEDRIATPDDAAGWVLEQVGDEAGWLVGGSGLSYPGCASLVGRLEPADADVLPEAAAVLRLARPLWQAGRTLDAASAAPVYLRDESRWQRSGGS